MSHLLLKALVLMLTAFVSIRPFLGTAVAQRTATCTKPLCTATMSAATSFEKLTTLCRDLSSLYGISGLLSWDEQVMMPKGAGASRGKQKAAIASVLHERATSVALLDAIEGAKKEWDSLDKFERAIVRDAERDYKLKVGVPAELEREIAEHETISVQKWIEAREKDDFDSYAPYLKKMFELTKKKALAMNPNQEPYDTLVDTFERGMTSDRLSEIFDEIKTPLKQLLERTLKKKHESVRKVHPSLSGGDDWDVDKQAALCKQVCNVLGFNFENGRIDVSVHPFTGGAGPTDVRITTRYSTALPFEGIMGTVHEAGHAMYEQGRNDKYEGLPVSEALSMGVHESQSLFWERMIGQTVGFWRAVIDKIHAQFPHTKGANADEFYYAVNQVNRNLIRVEADEVTYPFHIIVRFEIEKMLMDGSLEVEDLAKVWKEKMQELVGIEVPNDREGVLQDVHWPSGAVGYFPSYTLGAMMAAQLAAYLQREAMPQFDEYVNKGNFKPIKDWLNAEVHVLGSVYPSLDELLVQVTGEPLKPKYFLEYLEKKYGRLYD